MEAWLLKGEKRVFPKDKGDPEWRQISEIRGIAVALSWGALCRSELTGAARGKSRELAERCLVNLAVARQQAVESTSPTLGVLRQALHLDPTNSRASFRLATVLEDSQQFRQAISAYFGVLRSPFLRGPSPRSAASRLAKLLVRLINESRSEQDEQEFRVAGNELLKLEDSRQLLNKKVFDELAEACGIRKDESVESKEDVEQKRALKRAGLARKYDTKAQEAREKNNLDEASRYAAKAQKQFEKAIEILENQDKKEPDLYRELADCYLADNKLKKAQEIFQKAIDDLAERDTLAQDFYIDLAKCYLDDDNPKEALQYSRIAVDQEPSNPENRKLLARNYYALGEYELAEGEWQVCLDLVPEDWESLQGIANTYWARAALLRRPEERRKSLSRVVEIFDNALELSEDLDTVGWIHFWLGSFHADLRNYDQATYHFNVSICMEYKPLETRVQRGFNYIEAKAYDEAEDAFNDAITEVEKFKKNGGAFDKKLNDTEEYQVSGLLAAAHLGLAWTFATRKLKMQRALELVNSASGLIANADKPVLQVYQLDPFQHECLGLIHLNKDEIDEAIDEFEKSVDVRVNGTFDDGVVYYYLARAYLVRAQSSIFDSARWLTRSRECCMDARNASIRSVYDEDVGALLKQLDSLETSLAAAKAKAGLAESAHIVITPSSLVPVSCATPTRCERCSQCPIAVGSIPALGEFFLNSPPVLPDRPRAEELPPPESHVR